MYAGIIRRNFGLSDEWLGNVDRADFHKLAKAAGLSRVYNAASSREVSWRYVRGKSQHPNFNMGDSMFENRDGNWEKEARKYQEELREKARVKHDYVPMNALGFCSVCGEREYARISETSYGVTVWRRVHTNPKLLVVNRIQGNQLETRRQKRLGKEVCPASGIAAPIGDPGDRIACICTRSVLITADGMIRRHFTQ